MPDAKLYIRKGNATIAAVLLTATALCAANPTLDGYIDEIDQLMSSDLLDAARQKIRQAKALDIYDERLVILESRLRLLQSLDTAPAIPVSGSNQAAANYLVNTISRAVESGQISRVSEVSEFSANTRNLLNALFAQYAKLRVKVSYPLPNLTGNGYTSTLQIVELMTADGNIAFPSPAWSTHEIQVTKSSDENLKAFW